MEKQDKQNEKDNNEEQKPEEVIIHKGLFIANERRKKKGGRIKSTSMDNKIEVPDAFEVLHEAEVEWIEIRRYDRKQKKGKNPQKNKKEHEKKNVKSKFVEKEVQKPKKQKYVLKKEPT